MVLCTEESPSGSEQNPQATSVTPAEVSADDAPRNETKQMSADRQAHTSESAHDGANLSATPPKMSKGSDKDSSQVPLAHEKKQISADSRAHTSESVHEGASLSATPSKTSERDSSLVPSVLEEKKTSIPSERALALSPKWALSLPPGHGGSTPPAKAEKASEDGFNWRKYGQKNVKGNEFIRSYYKCTHSNCLVKKQVQRSLEGQITNTVYFGQHEHPKPHINIPLAIGLVVSIVEEKNERPSSTITDEKPSELRGQTYQLVKTTDTPLSPVVTTSADVRSAPLLSPRSRLRDEVNNDDDPSSKRKKKENRSVDAAAVDKATGESRLITQTTSEVDTVNDGYRWRKYGQKLVKGNPNPRSYYRCSSPGCPVKKHVERASHDPKVVMTTYEGQHDHGIPAARTVTRNPAGTNGATSAENDEAITKSEEGAAVSADAAMKEERSGRPSQPIEQQHDKSENKSDATRSSILERDESISKEQQKGEPSPPSNSHGDRGTPTASVPRSTSTEEQSSSRLAAKPEESEGVCLNKVGKKSNEQQPVLSSAAAVQS